MKRVVCTHVGDTPAESVALVEGDPPAVGEADVLVRVLARPINPADELLLTGRHVFQPTYHAPVGIEDACRRNRCRCEGARVEATAECAWNDRPSATRR
jgi:hypothetical protein